MTNPGTKGLTYVSPGVNGKDWFLVLSRLQMVIYQFGGDADYMLTLSY